MTSGPLAGVRIVELAGIGPGPFACMLLADMGAEVIQIERIAAQTSWIPGFMSRGRRSVALDLKNPDGVGLALAMVDRADILVEGFRPGVVERLGIGPEVCLNRNPALVYGRMTGWGQDGPLADTAGHDIDYLAIAGALWPMGIENQTPPVPLNLVADFGGGAMFLVAGVLAALHESRNSGIGQVVDAAMVDGVAMLTTMFHEMRAKGLWVDERSSNLLDGAAPFYTTYRTADGEYMAVGALEPQFYAELLSGLGLSEVELPEQLDRSGWPALREVLADAFASRSRQHWESVFEGTDACVSPVLSWDEAVRHNHNEARRTFVESGGTPMPGPAPRFSVHPERALGSQPDPGEHTDEILSDLGLDSVRISELRRRGIVG